MELVGGRAAEARLGLGLVAATRASVELDERRVLGTSSMGGAEPSCGGRVILEVAGRAIVVEVLAMIESR